MVRRRRPAHPTDRLPVAFGAMPYALGTNMAIWRAELDRIGGWNPDITAGTDVELCLRAHRHGLSLGYAPAAVVGYRLPVTWRHLIAQNYRWGRTDGLLTRTYGLTTERNDRAATRRAVHRVATGRDSPVRLAAYLLGRATPAGP